METQKKWHEYGNELTGAFSELANFEKTFKPELEAKIREHDVLEKRAEKLSAHLAAEKADLDKKKVTIFAGMREAAGQTTSDLRAEKLLPKAKAGAAEIHSYGLDILKIERDLVDTQLKMALISEWPFQIRRQQARKFFLTLIQTAGLGLQYQTGDSSFGQTAAWSDKLKALETRIGIMEGTVAKFESIGYGATSPDDILSMAAMLPKEDLPQLIVAWQQATIESAEKIGLTYTRAHSLKWRIVLNHKKASRILNVHDDLGFDIGGSSTRRTAKA